MFLDQWQRPTSILVPYFTYFSELEVWCTLSNCQHAVSTGKLYQSWLISYMSKKIKMKKQKYL